MDLSVQAQRLIESAAERTRASVRPEALRMDIRVQAQRPIESAAERTRASVGPEGRTERSNYRVGSPGNDARRNVRRVGRPMTPKILISSSRSSATTPRPSTT